MVDYLVAADLHRAARLREAAMRYARGSLVWLKSQQGWKKWFGDNKDLVIELLEG